MTALESRVAVLLLAAIGALSACSPVTPKGWSARQMCGAKGNCGFTGSSPDDGRWLNFHVGMAHEAALSAACDAVRSRQAKIDGFSIAPDGRCSVADWIRKPSYAAYSLWSARADGFWCLPWGGAVVYLDVSEKDGHLERIAAYCQNTFDP
jgi:hypothetical protein